MSWYGYNIYISLHNCQRTKIVVHYIFTKKIKAHTALVYINNATYIFESYIWFSCIIHQNREWCNGKTNTYWHSTYECMYNPFNYVAHPSIIIIALYGWCVWSIFWQYFHNYWSSSTCRLVDARHIHSTSVAPVGLSITAVSSHRHIKTWHA